jgi:hypothetical protein
MRLLRSGDRSGTDPPPSPSSTDAFNRHRGARSATRVSPSGSSSRAGKTTPSPRDVENELSERPLSSPPRLWRSALHVSSVRRPGRDRQGSQFTPSRSHPRGFERSLGELVLDVPSREVPRATQGRGCFQRGASLVCEAPLWSFDREAVERGGAGGRSPPAFIRPGCGGEAPACVDGQNHPAMRPERQGTMRISRPFETSMSVVLPNVATRSITPCM